MIVSVEDSAARNEFNIAVEEHPMKGRGCLDAVQSSRFASANQGIESADVPQLLPEVRLQRVKVGGADQFESHHVVAPTVPP